MGHGSVPPPSMKTEDYRRLRALAGIMVFLVTLLNYLPSLRNGFTNWDDNTYVYANMHIQRPLWDVFGWAFAKFYAGNWHPLTWISHAIDYGVWGLNPVGHHLTSNVIHALNAMLVTFVCFRLLDCAAERQVPGNGAGPFAGERDIVIAGAFTGLLFGIHPIHVESVAWVSERKDLLCGMFFCLSLLAYLRYADAEKYGRPAPGNYLLSLVLFACALLSKPMAVTLPVVMLIADWYPLGKIRSLKTFASTVTEKLPFIALSTISAVVTFLAEDIGGHVVPLKVADVPARLLVAAQALFSYLLKMVLPMGLVPFYPYPGDVSMLSVRQMTAVLAIFVITGCVIVFRTRKLWLAIWAYYIVTLLPVLGIVRVGMQSMADRYAYLPSIGPFFVLGLAVARGYGGADGLKRRMPGRSFMAAAVAGCVLLFLSVMTVKQISVWRNSITLWDYVIEREPSVAFAYNNRGVARMDEGANGIALRDFNTAIALKPGYAPAYYNRGLAHDNEGTYGEAIRDFTKAISLKPGYSEAFNDRGRTYERQGMHDKAIRDFTKAISLKPDYSEAFNNRGISFGKEGALENAQRDFARAIALNPNYFEAVCNLGFALMLDGKYEKAAEAYTGAIALEPKSAAAYVSRARVRLKSGRNPLQSVFQRVHCNASLQGLPSGLICFFFSDVSSF
ncbi:MAG: tetratricopeptide repeat protein [Candidatus Sulfobium sp.]